MSLDDIVKEAEAKKLTANQVETAKRQYYFGILQYETRHPEPDYHRFGSAILGIIHHQKQAEYCGEAHARKYIRETEGINYE